MIEIFHDEYKDRLSNQLQNNSVALASSINFANPNQDDLFYMESVLVSVGWNDNDDVFDKAEVWSARNTPVDKQFNFMHKETEIIGHITSSKVVSDGSLILDDAKEVPDKYDIIVGSVLYRHWNDKNLQSRMNQIIAEIMENKWFVSMECLFPSFDYALIDPNGQHLSLTRSSETSFLTKHLRAYGGTGEYQGYKIGRQLKGFSFSGKGLVEKPANKRSVIFNYSDTSDIESKFKVAASKENEMSDQDKVIQALETKLAAAEKAAKDVADKAVANQISEFEARIAKLQSELEVTQNDLKLNKDKLTVSEEVQANKADEITKLTKQLEDTKSELSIKEAELSKIVSEKTQANRMQLFAGRVIDEAKARNLVDKCQTMTDETFQILVDSFAVKKDEKDDKNKDDETDKKGSKAQSETEILDELEALGIAMSVEADTSSVDKERSAAASWMKSFFKKKKKKEN